MTPTMMVLTSLSHGPLDMQILLDVPNRQKKGRIKVGQTGILTTKTETISEGEEEATEEGVAEIEGEEIGGEAEGVFKIDGEAVVVTLFLMVNQTIHSRPRIQAQVRISRLLSSHS